MYEKIKELCKEKNISVRKLEEDLGFSNGSIYKWITSSPSIDRVEKVASYFNIDINELLKE